jgi:hypothetical protein
MRCCSCDNLSDPENGAWQECIAAVPSPDEPVKLADGFHVVDINTAKTFIRRHQQTIDSEEVAAIILIRKQLGVTTWSIDYETREQKSWLRRQFAVAMKQMRMKCR